MDKNVIQKKVIQKNVILKNGQRNEKKKKNYIHPSMWHVFHDIYMSL